MFIINVRLIKMKRSFLLIDFWDLRYMKYFSFFLLPPPSFSFYPPLMILTFLLLSPRQQSYGKAAQRSKMQHYQSLCKKNSCPTLKAWQIVLTIRAMIIKTWREDSVFLRYYQKLEGFACSALLGVSDTVLLYNVKSLVRLPPPWTMQLFWLPLR